MFNGCLDSSIDRQMARERERERERGTEEITKICHSLFFSSESSTFTQLYNVLAPYVDREENKSTF